MNDEIVIASKGRLVFSGCSELLRSRPAKPRSVIDDLLGPNPSPDAEMVYLTNSSIDDEVGLMGPQDPLRRAEFNLQPSYHPYDERCYPEAEDDLIPLAVTREPTYRTEFKLQPFQAEAMQKFLGQTQEAYQRAMDRMVGDIFMVPARRFGKTVTATTATETALRVEKMWKKLRLNAEYGRSSNPFVNIIYNEYATKPTGERLFPFSRHRSARISKKLMKRFGGVYRHEPAIWKMGGMIIAHPSFRAEIEAKLAEVAE
ncbi:MAG: hypothetical protein PBV01_10330 [Brucella anthropi]